MESPNIGHIGAWVLTVVKSCQIPGVSVLGDSTVYVRDYDKSINYSPRNSVSHFRGFYTLIKLVFLFST